MDASTRQDASASNGGDAAADESTTSTTSETASSSHARLLVPPARTRSRSASLPAPFHASQDLMQALTASHQLLSSAAPAVGPSASFSSSSGSHNAGAISDGYSTTSAAALVAAASSSMRGRRGNESDALERLKMRKYYYRRLADPHTLFERSYLPGERTLLERTKCIGLSMPNAAICIISGRLVVTNFRVIFDPTSGDDFLKVPSPIF
jgi:hypothetical protein